MHPLSYDHTTAVELLRDQLDSILAAADTFSDYDLLGASRVHGWSRLDAVVHVRLGLEEMAGVCANQVDGAPDHDAASYWVTFAEDEDDPTPHILWMRRTAAAYAEPRGALRHLDQVADMIRIALRRMPDHPVLFQGKTMTSGDFLATWVLELAVHQLDLGEEAGHPTAGSLFVVRETVEALADVRLPDEWDDEYAALVALGRLPVPELPEDRQDLVQALPVSI